MKNKKVILGLSGGVDSSVAAILLKEQGYKVECLFMRNWDSTINNDFLGNPNNLANICPQEQDYLDAKSVANALGVILHRVDFIKEYWDYVFKYFIDEYEKGRTPNPDILCNKYIKFNYFLKYSLENLNADYISMGHYAGTRLNIKTGETELIRGLDDDKDQSYFLCKLNQNQVSKVLFPLQKYKKIEIREIAKKNNLKTAEKKDSTGICFIGERNFTKFLQNYIPNQPGDIVDIKSNKVLGKHIGIMYYTIGQRKGLNLGGQEHAYYVAKKDLKNKIIYVCNIEDESYLYSTSCYVNDVNFIVNLKNYFKNSEDFNCTVKFRYRQKDINVNVKKQNDNSYLLTYPASRAVTEGQEAVFYLNEICLGGATINKVLD